MCVCEYNILKVRPGFWNDEMDGFEKSAKTTRTTRTPPQVPIQMTTRAQTAAYVTAAAAAEITTAETVVVNTTDTDTIIATENLINIEQVHLTLQFLIRFSSI